MSYLYTGTIRSWQGTALAAQSVTVYTDAAGTVEASLTDSVGTAVANPTTTDSRGRVEVYLTAARLWYKVAGDSIVQRLVRLCDLVQASVSGLPWLNVMDFGATGNGSDDDTDAIQDAIDAAASTGSPLFIPAGVYIVSNFDDITTVNVHIQGAGRELTILRTASAGAVFSLGTYSATPANAWAGTGAGFHLSGLTIQNDAKDTKTSVGVDQTSIGIQDNGSGSVTLRDVGFKGLLYGIYAPYGHDICTYYNVDFYACTTDMYFGPGSQQIHIFGGRSDLHDRAFVIEGARQGSVSGFTFIDPKTRDIDVLSPNTLESGISAAAVTAHKHKELTWTFNDCWFETGAGYTTGWGPVEHVRIGSAADTNVCRYVKFRDARLISGTSGMAAHDGGTTYVFANVDKGDYILIDGLQVDGSYIQAMVKTPAASYRNVTIRNHKTTDGYTGINAFASKQTGNVEVTDWYHGFNHTAYTAVEVTGDRSDGVALTNLLTALKSIGIIIDSTTA